MKWAGGRQARVDPKDLLALQSLAPIISGYVPWSGSALAPQTAQQVCNELELNGRRSIVELGPGVSTLVMAMWAEAEQEAIRVISIDEDSAWIDLMARRLERFTYADVSLLHAPLTPRERQEGAPSVARWYDASVVDSLPGPVDMLLVDGPTAYREEWKFDRWPALPHLADRLAPACAVLLDDTARAGEAAVLHSWRQMFPDFVRSDSGPATWLRRGKAWQT